MANTGVKYAATVSEGAGNQAWDAGTLDVAALNSVGSDYALLTGADFDLNKTGGLVNCSNFSMGVPAGSTITGILVEISVINSPTTGGVCDNLVSLSKVAATPIGDNKASATLYNTATYTTQSYGGDGVLWGTTWSVNEVNATGFGVVYQPLSKDPNEDMGLDFIRITVFYTTTPASISVSESLAFADTSVPPIQKMGTLLMSMSEAANFQEVPNYILGELKTLISETINYQEGMAYKPGTLLLENIETANFQESFALKLGELLFLNSEIFNLQEAMNFEPGDLLLTNVEILSLEEILSAFIESGIPLVSLDENLILSIITNLQLGEVKIVPLAS